MKIGNFKSETPVREKHIALTGVTGHKIHTLGKVKLTIKLGKEEIHHSVYVVRDDFPMDYEGILGIDFLAKQKARSRKKDTKYRQNKSKIAIPKGIAETT
ncbi:hypothetical protein P5V15_011387 [Pogonomyrmex californicus]